MYFFLQKIIAFLSKNKKDKIKLVLIYQLLQMQNYVQHAFVAYLLSEISRLGLSFLHKS